MRPKRGSIVMVLGLIVGLVGGVTMPGASGALRPGVTVKKPEASGGYTLVASNTTPRTYLVDLDGNVVHAWTSDTPVGVSAYLLPNGQLLRAEQANPIPTQFAAAQGGQGGVVQELAWNGDVKYSFTYANAKHLQHHDAIAMPNGHLLMLAWDYKTPAEAIAMGRDPALLSQGALWPDSIVEVDPKRDAVVWEWHAWDHLVQARDKALPNYGRISEHPARIDVNWATGGGQASWQHFNGLDYNAKLDQILVSTREFSEIWVIDHHTTTRAAKGKAGDLMFRWGNPAAYRSGNARDRRLFFQHNPQWIRKGLPDAGHMMVFNNGDGETRPYSTVDEIQPVMKGRTYPKEHGKFRAKVVRTVYPTKGATPSKPVPAASPSRFFAPFISGAQRLPNGNTLITDGPTGRVFEVTKHGTTVWSFQNEFAAPVPTITAPNGFVVRPERLFRSYRYGSAYSGLARLGLGARGSSTGKADSSY